MGKNQCKIVKSSHIKTKNSKPNICFIFLFRNHSNYEDVFGINLSRKNNELPIAIKHFQTSDKLYTFISEYFFHKK